MQQFFYQLNYDGNSYALVGYKGDEEDVVIPEKYGGLPISVLSDKLFEHHKEIRSVKIPDSVTDMGEFMFDGCDNLKELKLPSSLQNLWGYTFVRCSLEEVYLPDGLISLPPFAFKDSKKLRKVVCGSKLKKIHPWVFGGCDLMTRDGLICSDSVDISPEAFSTKTLNS